MVAILKNKSRIFDMPPSIDQLLDPLDGESLDTEAEVFEDDAAFTREVHRREADMDSASYCDFGADDTG